MVGNSQDRVFSRVLLRPDAGGLPPTAGSLPCLRSCGENRVVVPSSLPGWTLGLEAFAF